MARSPVVDSTEWVNPRFRWWRHPRSPLADANGWINPRLGRIRGCSHDRGHIRGDSRRGRGRIPASSRGRDRDLVSYRDRSPQFNRGDEGPNCNPHNPLSVGEPTGRVGDSTPTGGEAGGEEEFKRRFVVSEADKSLWESYVAEVDREVDGW